MFAGKKSKELWDQSKLGLLWQTLEGRGFIGFLRKGGIRIFVALTEVTGDDQ